MPRDRSRVVCRRCHARKVKCDLLPRLWTVGVCTNCEKRNELCQRRDRTTTSQPLVSSQQASSSEHPLSCHPVIATPRPTSFMIGSAAAQEEEEEEGGGGGGPASPSDVQGRHGQRRHHAPPAARVGSIERGYIGEYSVMSNHGPLGSESGVSLGSPARSLESQSFMATAAHRLPPQSMIDASIVAYFQYLYHRIPVIDRQDVACDGPSTLLLQSLCFLGSFLRHPKSTESVQQTELLYTKAKILFFLNHEHEPLTILKALCIFTLWNVRPPSVVTIDSSWNWLGLATRFAIQMGLHRDSTYAQRPTPSCARRIAWYLYSQDKMLSACFGRPVILKTEDFDLRPLSTADFDDAHHDQARLFILYTQLAQITAKMLSIQHGGPAGSSEDVLSVLADLRAWVLDIPVQLRMLDDNGNRVYHREFYEILASYLTQIITYFHIFGDRFQPSVASRISLIASSCMIALYREMDHRDDINYLTAINNWSMMTAALPQLNHISREMQRGHSGEGAAGSKSSSWQELDTIVDILKQRTVKFPGAHAIVHRLEQLKQEILSQAILIHHERDTSAFSGSKQVAAAAAHSTGPASAVVSRVHELFPFPKTLSPALDLLDELEAESTAEALFDGYPDWGVENLFGLDDINLVEFA